MSGEETVTGRADSYWRLVNEVQELSLDIKNIGNMVEFKMDGIEERLSKIEQMLAIGLPHSACKDSLIATDEAALKLAQISCKDSDIICNKTKVDLTKPYRKPVSISDLKKML